MKIGIVGAGKVGGGLGKLWARAGHQVFFSSRHPDRLKLLVEQSGPGSCAGTVAEAAVFGEVILFSPNFWSVDDALEAIGPLEGKTVVDVTNPLEWNPNGRMVRSLPVFNHCGRRVGQKTPGGLRRQSLQHGPRVFHSPRILQTRSAATFSGVLLRRSPSPANWPFTD